MGEAGGGMARPRELPLHPLRRLQAVLARIPPAVVDHGIACETHLADLLCRPRLPKRPCLAPAAVLHQEALDDDFEFVGDVDE